MQQNISGPSRISHGTGDHTDGTKREAQAQGIQGIHRARVCRAPADHRHWFYAKAGPSVCVQGKVTIFSFLQDTFAGVLSGDQM